MFTPTPLHRLLLAILIITLVPLSAGAAVDMDDCLEDATDERTDALSDAYSMYNDLMDKALNNFGDVERDAYRITDDSSYRSGEVYRAQNSYTRQMEEANRNLNTRVRNIWNDYNAKVALCNGNAYNYSSSTYSRHSYPNSAYNFVYPQSYSYSYPYSYQYSSPYLYYPYSYSYPQYDYAIYPYSYGSYYVSRPGHYQTDPYAHPYYRGRGTCRAPNVGNPPAGCAYKFYLDEEGCYEYKLKC
jgi:hypothetical protein